LNDYFFQDNRIPELFMLINEGGKSPFIFGNDPALSCKKDELAVQIEIKTPNHHQQQQSPPDLLLLLRDLLLRDLLDLLLELLLFFLFLPPVPATISDTLSVVSALASL
jgi:hypothetical protein